MKHILYIGETSDFSDLWLIEQIRNHYNLELLDLAQEERDIPATKDIILILNRLYASAVERHGSSKAQYALRIIDQISFHGAPVINSTSGYQLYIDRMSQFRYFSSRGISYVETFDSKFQHEQYNQPRRSYVLKGVTAGRTKELPIVRDMLEFISRSKVPDNRVVIQPLIEGNICYRTEFVGRWSATFVQNIEIKEDKLTFWRGGIVTTPLSTQFESAIRKATGSIGVQAFSIEYFLLDSKPLIIDFNCTSNYSKSFIDLVGEDLKGAWLEVIEDAISS
jgi:hypothetical protein